MISAKLDSSIKDLAAVMSQSLMALALGGLSQDLPAIFEGLSEAVQNAAAELDAELEHDEPALLFDGWANNPIQER